MENKSNKIFINGLISKDVPDSTPEFILGQGSIQVASLIAWLQENRDKEFAKSGWINYKIMKSKSTGKRYVEVDTWAKQVPQAHGPETVDMPIKVPPMNVSIPKSNNPYDGAEEILPSDLPF